MKKNEDSLRDFWDNIKHTNIQIVGVPEGEVEKAMAPYLPLGYPCLENPMDGGAW